MQGSGLSKTTERLEEGRTWVRCLSHTRNMFPLRSTLWLRDRFSFLNRVFQIHKAERTSCRVDELRKDPAETPEMHSVVSCTSLTAHNCTQAMQRATLRVCVMHICVFEHRLQSFIMFLYSSVTRAGCGETAVDSAAH